MASEPEGSGAGFGWALVALIVVLGIGASCSRQNKTPSDAPTDTLATENLTAPVVLPPPLPLDASAVQRGAAQMKLVASITSPGAAHIFSQNCYDALAKSFDWHQLDRCGGFDAMAVRWAEQSPDASPGELSWFQSEAAAARFLTAATSNGQEGTQADLRWAGLEAAVQKMSPAKEQQATDTPNLALSAIPESEFQNHIGANCMFRMASVEPLIVNLGRGRIRIDGSSVELAGVPNEWNDLVEGGTYFAGDRKVTVTPAAKPDEVGYEISVRSAVVRIEDGERAVTHKGKWQCGL